MLYRESGQYKSSYAADQAIFPIMLDRIGLLVILFIAFVLIPIFATEYWLSSIMLPFLIFALAAIGLNILTGYAGQLSLATCLESSNPCSALNCQRNGTALLRIFGHILRPMRPAASL